MIKTTQKAGLKVKLGSREVIYSYWWRTQVIICYKCGNRNNPLWEPAVCRAVIWPDSSWPGLRHRVARLWGFAGCSRRWSFHTEVAGEHYFSSSGCSPWPGQVHLTWLPFGLDNAPSPQRRHSRQGWSLCLDCCWSQCTSSRRTSPGF